MSQTAPDKNTGIKELAQRLGISIGTVSRALNGRYGVKPQTRTRVLEEARRMGYVANSAARELRARPSLTIGLFFAPFLGLNHEINPGALNFVKVLGETAERQSASLQTIFFSSDTDLETAAKAHHLDAAVFLGQFTESSFTRIHQIGIPAVVLHFPSSFPDQFSITIDMHRAASHAVQYLAALGHVEIGIMTNPRVNPQAAEYYAGFVESMREFRLPFPADWDFELPGEKANKFGANEALKALFQSPHRPTAMLFASDWMALGGLQAAKEAGLAVPGDLSLIGFENTLASAEVEPPLTTFDFHMPHTAELVIQTAAKLVEERRQGLTGEGGREIKITTDLVKRRSCASTRA